ncbi:hypothetical protein GGR55DRAFT_630591 [Xylaria sp. FL0064]|nr:hypothetical protein GGR55DRAFT_630591 [Xylaria sp. FL0064]
MEDTSAEVEAASVAPAPMVSKPAMEDVATAAGLVAIVSRAAVLLAPAIVLSSVAVLKPGRGTSSAAGVVSAPAAGLRSGMAVLEASTTVDCSDATSPSAADVSRTADVSTAADVSTTAEVATTAAELWIGDAVVAPGSGCNSPVVTCAPGRAARAAVALAAAPCCVSPPAFAPIPEDSSWLALLPASCCWLPRDEPLASCWRACISAFLAGAAYTLLANSSASAVATFACFMLIGAYACLIAWFGREELASRLRYRSYRSSSTDGIPRTRYGKIY